MTKHRLGRDLERMLSLYLDGRLPEAERAGFEQRMRTDRALRQAVEFQRGLTLELHEEAPPLPAGYAERARARLDRARETGARESGGAPRRADRSMAVAVPWWRRSFVLQAAGAAAAVVLVAAVLYPRLAGHRIDRLPSEAASEVSPGPAAEPVPPGPSTEADREKSDRETVDALRSLGYLSSGKPAAARAATTPPAAAAPSAAPPEKTKALAGAATPTPAFPVVAVARGPELGRDHQVVRSAEEWAPFAAPAGAEPPAASFDRQMVVVLRDDLGGEPPRRLRVVSVTPEADALVIECRIEPRDPSAAAPPGQAIAVPATDLPVRILVR